MIRLLIAILGITLSLSSSASLFSDTFGQFYLKKSDGSGGDTIYLNLDQFIQGVVTDDNWTEYFQTYHADTFSATTHMDTLHVYRVDRAIDEKLWLPAYIYFTGTHLFKTSEYSEFHLLHMFDVNMLDGVHYVSPNYTRTEHVLEQINISVPAHIVMGTGRKEFQHQDIIATYSILLFEMPSEVSDAISRIQEKEDNLNLLWDQLSDELDRENETFNYSVGNDLREREMRFKSIQDQMNTHVEALYKALEDFKQFNCVILYESGV